MTKAIQKIGQIGVPVKDLERAAHFYSEVLELDLLFKADTMAFLECNGVRIMLSLPEKDEFAFSSSIIYYQVENLNDKYQELKEAGVSFMDEPHIVAKMGQTETWMTFFKDSEDNTVALMSEIQV